MRSIRFLPLVFLLGIDGFAMFAPYMMLILAAAYFLRKTRPDSGLEALTAAS
jgi:hypothetical protein